MDRVTIQFEKLKSQGKINIAEKVRMSKVDTFEAKSKAIEYNKGMNKLQNDEINFYLLHEEGHFVDRRTKYIIITIIFIIYVYIWYFTISNLSGFVSKFLYVALAIFLLIILLVRIMSKLSQHHEYKADDYACEKIDNPLRIELVFKQARYHSTNTKNPLNNILNTIFPRHPSDKDRINRMKKNHSRIIVLEKEKER